MGFWSRVTGKSKKGKAQTEAERAANNLHMPEEQSTGTTLRRADSSTPPTKEKSGLQLKSGEIPEYKTWEVKNLPEWRPGDEILGLYKVEDVIKGGMGRVYIAEHKEWRVKLALKQPNEMMLSNRDFFARVLREAEAWMELGLHPNIAYCYHVRNMEEVPHIVVEYADGGNLRQWIEDGKCIDYRVSLDLAIQFCHGMEHAHKKGMIHRDIKPENVLMTKDGQLKITDFGLVRSRESIPAEGKIDEAEGNGSSIASGKGLTRVGDVMGTEGYMAPEQFEDAAGVDERADIFAFGVCLYEMFCGDKPYQITYGQKQSPPDPSTLSRDKDFPKELNELLTRCVQQERKSRYQTFPDIRQDLCSIHQDLFGEKSHYEKMEQVDLEADGLNNRGVSYLELEKKKEAIFCFEKALQKNETHPEAIFNKSLIQWRGGEITDTEVLNRITNMFIIM